MICPVTSPNRSKVTFAIKALKRSKAASPEVCAKLLPLFIGKSWESEIFPRDSKNEMIVKILNKRICFESDNYRGIRMLFAATNILKKTLQHINEHLENLINKEWLISFLDFPVPTTLTLFDHRS